MIDPRINETAFADSFRSRLQQARPFPHVLLDDLFDPRLLECVLEEFDQAGGTDWRAYRNPHEQTFRSSRQAALGPASRLYFDLVNSDGFIRFLGRVTGIDALIADTGLFGGGLHESRNGGHFAIHRDFDLHPQTGLRNRMVLLTYLNRNWSSEWNGDLELWDAQRMACVAKVAPTFGTSLLMMHGTTSFHGHPTPLSMPDGVSRRSLGSYYYSADAAIDGDRATTSTNFLRTRRDYLIAWGTIARARRWTPPALWELARRMRRYWSR